MVDIIIISWNALDYLKRCVESVFKYTHVPFQIIIVDNNSNFPTKEYLKSLGDKVKVIYNDKNYGFSHANNQAIDISTSEYVCFLNSDTIVTDNWLEKFIDILKNKEIGMAGPVTNFVSMPAQVVDFSHVQDILSDDDSKIQKRAIEIFNEFKYKTSETNRLIGFCLCTRKDVLENVGEFDDRYEVGCFEDDDICFKTIERGYKLVIANGIFVYHFGGKSFEDNFKVKTNYDVLEKNKKLFVEKWYLTNRVGRINQVRKPLRIVYLLASNTPVGGVKIVYEHANRLKRKGHRVEIICHEKVTSNNWFPVIVPIIFNQFDKIPECDILVGSYFTTLPYVARARAKVKIHLCQGYEALLHGDKSVLDTIHSNYAMIKDKITVSKWLKEMIDKEYNINSTYISNALDTHTFSFKRHSFNRIPRILITGSENVTFKGVDVAMKAFKEKMKTNRMQLVRLSGSPQVDKSVDCEFHQMDNMTQTQIAKVYESCDICISASRKVEGFMLHPLEAMASGTAVITTNCGGVIDYAIDRYNCLMVPPEDSLAIGNAIETLLQKRSLHNSLADNGIETAKKFLWHTRIDQLEKTFYDLYFESINTVKEKISVCMIVKNEEKDLRKCLNNIKNLASEIVIVDTGSTDDTIKIAKQFGASIYHFKWNDNFSDARNFALQQVTQPWTFIIDADEIVAERDIVRFKELLKTNCAYSFVTRNYVNDARVEGVIACVRDYVEEENSFGWCPSAKVRLFPTNKKIRFEGQVHELVEKSISNLGIKILNADIPIHHYSYLKKKRKDEFYLKLNQEKAKENKDVSSIYELAIQYMALNNFDEALVMWRRLLEIDPNNYDYLARIGTTYNLLNNCKEAEVYFLSSLEKEKSEYAYKHLGVCYAKQNKFQKAYDCFKIIAFTTNDMKTKADFACCCNKLRRFDETIEILESCLKIDRRLTISWGLLEIAYNEKGVELAKSNKFKKAAFMFKQALDISPNFDTAKANLRTSNILSKRS